MMSDIRNNIKNVFGWRTAEKLIVFAVDDYGSVRLDSLAARIKIEEAGLELVSRFDRYDSLETREDLEALLEVLSSTSDGEGRSPVFTAYSLSANPAFDRMSLGQDDYQYESLAESFERTSAEQPLSYEGAWPLWEEGMRRGLLRPQFHGREHLNVELIQHKLKIGDSSLKINLANRSLVALDENPAMPGVGFTHAFAYVGESSLQLHREILTDGLRLFENTFGLRSTTFTPPAMRLRHELYAYLELHGVLGIDKPLRVVRGSDEGHRGSWFNTLGQKRGEGHVSIVRNVLFEPSSDQSTDSVGLALSQIAAAFRWRKPAIISSHRVNFSGHIDPSNRKQGLDDLTRLLRNIVRRWPDAKFVTADELISKIRWVA